MPWRRTSSGAPSRCTCPQTDDNVSDGFTKAVDEVTFIRHFAMLRGLLAKTIDEDRVRGGTSGRGGDTVPVEASPVATELSSRPLQDDEAAPPEPELADDYVAPTGKDPAGHRG